MKTVMKTVVLVLCFCYKLHVGIALAMHGCLWPRSKTLSNITIVYSGVAKLSIYLCMEHYNTCTFTQNRTKEVYYELNNVQ